MRFNLLLLILFFSCNKIQDNKIFSQNVTAKKDFSKKEIIENVIKCDSIYNENLEVIFRKYIEYTQIDKKGSNSVFIFRKNTENGAKEILRDSIESDFGNIIFKDFNGDGIKDILVENISDVRSNLTYYLYLVDLKKEKLVKIKNFNTIKNPNYLKKYDLIDNMVMSGRNWIAFYKIVGDSIKNFEKEKYIVYWGQDENGNPQNPEKEYNKILNKILKK